MSIAAVKTSAELRQAFLSFFKDKGHDVTIMARSKPKGTSALNELPFMEGNYVEDDFSDGRLNGFDWLIFAGR